MDRIVLSEQHIKAVNRKRDIIANYDLLASFKPFTCEEVSPEDIIKYRLSLVDTGKTAIDSMFLCFSEGNEVPYPSRILPLFKLSRYKKWVEEGVDIVKEFVSACRKRNLECFFSYRMNGADNDVSVSYKQFTGSDAGKEYGPLLPMKKKHPGWLIKVTEKNEDNGEYIYFWNYEKKGVRDYRIACIEELLRNYELDGIELDFARLVPFLPPGKQWLLKRYLTEFVRDVRHLALEIEKEKQRPILIAVRVGDSAVGNRMDGIDIRAWIEGDLVDIIVPGSRSIEVDMCSFKELIKDKNIKIYPCHDGHHASDGYAFAPIEVLRGIYTNWIHQGSDGIQTLNFSNVTREACRQIKSECLIKGTGTEDEKSWDSHNLLCMEIREPEKLEKSNKTFVIQRRGGGGRRDNYMPHPEKWYTPAWGYTNMNMLAQLPVKLSRHDKVETQLFLYAGEKERNYKLLKGIKLRILLSQDSKREINNERYEKAAIRDKDSQIGLTYNLPPEAGIEKKMKVRFNGSFLYGGSEEKGWIKYDLTREYLAEGQNIIGVSIMRDAKNKEDEIIIEKVELDVRYIKGK